eukprot:UN10379
MGSQLNCMSAPNSSKGPLKSHNIAHNHHQRQRVKILFLDVDGVLNGENLGYGGVDDSLLFLLKTIIDETHCKIVLSTTWRLNQTTRQLLLHFMKANADINVDDIIIGDTPTLKNTNRAVEIETFLESKQFQSLYIVTQWCAIDDLNLYRYYPILMRNHFVRTNYRTGMTSNDAYQVVKILNTQDGLSNSYDY